MDMRDDAYEARQLAQWLNELKYLREKIERLTCEDAISRDDALKALNYDIKSFEFKSGVGKHMNEIAKLLNTIYEIQSNNIKALPPVQPKPKTGHWIPVSERLPEYGEEVLAYHEDDEEYQINWVTDDKTGEWFHENPTAWMPLPEKYKAESEAQDADSN